MIYLSLGFGTTAGTLVCALIALSFTGALLHTDLAIPVAMLFIAAVCCIGISLLISMREVYLAIRNIRFRYPVELRQECATSPAHESAVEGFNSATNS